MSNSHDTMIFASNKNKEIIFFKSYEYLKQKDEAQADLKFAQDLADKEKGAWYISTLKENSRWDLSATDGETYHFKISEPI